MKYIILNKKWIIDLEKEVNKYLKNGWECQGGLVISQSNNIKERYIQVIIKKEK